MPEDNERWSYDDGGKRAAQAWSNALRRLREAWLDATGEELNTGSDFSPKVRFENGISTVVNYLRTYRDSGKLLDELGIPDPTSVDETTITQSILSSVDLDDRSPNDVKAAFYTTARIVAGDSQTSIELRDFLRQALDQLYPNRGPRRRPNVGANRHWPRLLQYLQECERETDWSPDDRGFRLGNLGGRGPLPKNPTDPGRLRLSLDGRFI